MSKNEKIKKPQNAFFLYRNEIKNQIKLEHNVSKSREISKFAGLKWRLESQEVKQKYKERAQRDFENHKKLHPEYQWPSRSIEYKSRQRHQQKDISSWQVERKEGERDGESAAVENDILTGIILPKTHENTFDEYFEYI